MTLHGRDVRISTADTTAKSAMSTRTTHHDIIRIIASFAGTLALIEGAHWLFSSPLDWRALTVFVARCAVVVWFALDPEFGAIGVIAVQIVDFVIPYGTPASMLFLSLIAVGATGYLHLCRGLILAAVLGTGTLLNLLSFGGFLTTLENLIIYEILILASLVIGIMIRNIERRDEQEEHDRMMKRSARMAHRLHDYTTNDISNIIMLSDSILDTEDPSDQTQSIERIRRNAMDALFQTRKVIATLDDAGDGDGSSSATPTYIPTSSDLQHRISVLVNEQRDMLKALGFEGTTLMTSHLPPDANADGDMLIGLLHELFGNIARHASPRHGYTLTISADETHCDISLADTPITEVSGATVPKGPGSGLRRYKREILKRHGVWDIKTNSNSWSLHITIPWAKPSIGA